MDKEQVIVTEHPYVIKVAGVCGGRPIIKGTRTPVQAIVEYYRLGMDTYQILTELPYITEAQLHDGLSYFYDHKEEIEAGIEADHRLIKEHEKESREQKIVEAAS
jgi:uncharacterized protein (DUF433 family)